MKCPYQDIGCWYIDDETHDCEAEKPNLCRHEEEYNDGLPPEGEEEDEE